MLRTHAVGIDLGTTYSCLSFLNEHGEPVTLANQEGELATPSVVFFDGNEVIVGTEALRNAVARHDRVVQNSKRFMGDALKSWTIDGKSYSPIAIAAFILRKLLDAAQEQIGAIEQAVVTVPAQFSEIQRQATVEAAKHAGLKRVDIINEPVAAALCYVLGTEGLWFTELAEEQRIMVYDLGGGTFDLSLVKYHKNEVSVIASSGDLNLGGIDWNDCLEKAICRQFVKDFGEDPRKDPESRQALALELENTKRSLTVRPRAAITCQHAGHRKTYQVEQSQFEKLTENLVERTAAITKQMLKDNKMGWAHIDVILTTGGSSRMPMIRNKLKELGGRTLNTSLSPDQSIAHGATYYAGMLLTNSEFAKSILNEAVTQRLSQIKQRSVNARALGILVRDFKNRKRVPHYLIPANTPLPAEITQKFGTVIKNQKRVHLHIVESGTAADQAFVELGACLVDDLPPNLPEGTEIAVTISYDDQARVHVSAKDLTSGKKATTEIVRKENIVAQTATDDDFAVSAWAATAESPSGEFSPSQVVVLCSECDQPLNEDGVCPNCSAERAAKTPEVRQTPTKPVSSISASRAAPVTKSDPKPAQHQPSSSAKPIDDDEILKLLSTGSSAELPAPIPVKPAAPVKPPAPAKPVAPNKPAQKVSFGKAPPVPPSLNQPAKSANRNKRRADNRDAGEEEFWQLIE